MARLIPEMYLHPSVNTHSAATVILGRALGGENLNSLIHESPAGFYTTTSATLAQFRL